MTDAIVAEPAKLEFGRVVSRTFEALSGNLPVFAGLALLFSALPDAIIAALSLGAGAVGQTTGQSGGSVISMVTTAVLQAAVVHGAIVFYGGGKANFRDCVQTAGRTLAPVIGIGIIAGFGIVLGMILLIVPGVILAVLWAVAVPVRVVEGPGVIAALKRSAALTKGNRWTIFWLCIVAALVIIVGVVAIIGASVAILGLDSPFSVVVIEPVVGAAGSLFAACGVAALYQELRTTKEGAMPATLAAVFD